MNRYSKRVLAFFIAAAMIMGDFLPAAAAAPVIPDENEVLMEEVKETVEPENSTSEEETEKEEETELPSDPAEEAPEEELPEETAQTEAGLYAGGSEDPYLGRIEENENDLGTERYLSLNCWEVGEACTADAWKEIVLNALAFYEDGSVDAVGINFPNTNAALEIDAEIVREAARVLNPDYERCRLDYSYYNEAEQQGMNWTLDRPYRDASKNVKTSVIITPVKHTGVKVKFSTVDFPAEHVSLHVWRERGDHGDFAFAEAFGNDKEGENYSKDLWGFALSSGNVTAVTDMGGWYEENHEEEQEDGFNFWGVNYLEAGKEYLLAPFANVEGYIPVGSTRQLTVEGQSKVTWSCLTPQRASIDSKGVLSALNDGEIWVTAKYSGGLTVFRLWAEKVLYDMEFARESFTMNKFWYQWTEESEEPLRVPCEEYLGIRFYPSDCGIDPADLKWEVEDESVVELIPREPDGLPDGQIKAVDVGTTQVSASLTDEEGNILKTITCSVTVQEEEDILDGVDYPDAYAVMNFDSKLSEVHFRMDNDEEITGEKLRAATGSLSGVYEDGTAWSWEWKEPNTSLAAYKGMYGADFTAVYTEVKPNGIVQSQETDLWVRLVSIDAVQMINMVERTEADGPTYWTEEGWPEFLRIGESFHPDYCCVLSNGEGWELLPYWYDPISNPDGRLAAYWVGDAAKLLEKDDAGNLLTPYTYIADTKGKKSFGIMLKDLKTKKQLAKTVETVQVVEKEPIQFLNVFSGLLATEEDVQEMPQLKEGQMYLGIFTACEEGYTLSVKNADTSVAAIGKGTVTREFTDEESGTTFRMYLIPYTEKKAGTAVLTITASDELKSSINYRLEVADREPKLAKTTMEINRAWDYTGELVSVRLNKNYPLAGDLSVGGSIKVKTGKKTELVPASDYFAIEELSAEGYTPLESLYRGILTLKDRNLPDGTYTIELKAPVDLTYDLPSPESTAELPENMRNLIDQTEYTLKLTVKVTSKVPAVTVKQTKKVNTFYKGGTGDTAGDGLFTIKAADGAELCVEGILDWSAEVPVRYSFHAREEGDTSDTYRVFWDMDRESQYNKGYLAYRIPGYVNLAAGPDEEGNYSDIFVKPLTIQTEYKKPTLVLSAKSDTLYPNLNCGASSVRVLNKATGEEIQLQEIKDKTTKRNNVFEVSMNPDEWDTGVLYFSLNGENGVKSGKTDKLTIGVKEESWTDYVDITYSIKVDMSVKPKLKLSSSTVTLNKNEAIYESQEARVDLRLSGCSNLLYYGEDGYLDVRFTGADAKSRQVLNSRENSLALDYWHDRGVINVRFHDNKLEKGTYKFNVWVENGIHNGAVSTYTASAALTVKVVDEAPEKCVSLSTKGSIDVLRRDSTFLTVTPKLKNLQGEIRNGRLSGEGSWRFRAECDENGIFYIRAQEGAYFSTKNTYKVTLQMEIENDGNCYTISKELSIKVKQGSPKVKVFFPEGDTIYRQCGNAADDVFNDLIQTIPEKPGEVINIPEQEWVGNHLELQLTAAIGDEEIAIEDVELLSYRRDFLFFPWYWPEPSEPFEFTNYDPETGMIYLNNYSTEETLKNGKYTLKFAVYYRDKAGDTKVQEIKTSINMK